jgi:H+-transporting ATPase
MNHQANTTETTPDDAATLDKLSCEELETGFQTSPYGLASQEAQQRLTKCGPNELAKEKVNPLLKFLTYFWGPIRWMIEAAAILSAMVQHWADFAIILTLLIVNAVVGFWKEYQTGNAHLVETAQTVSHFQKAVLKIGDFLILLALAFTRSTSMNLRLGC